MSAAPELVYLLCPTDRFEPCRVEGRDTGPLVCTGCRLVYAPPAPASPRLHEGQTPVTLDLNKVRGGRG